MYKNSGKNLDKKTTKQFLTYKYHLLLAIPGKMETLAQMRRMPEPDAESVKGYQKQKKAPPGKGGAMASPARFERATFRLGGGCSIQLSYGDMHIQIENRYRTAARRRRIQLSRVSIPQHYIQNPTVCQEITQDFFRTFLQNPPLQTRHFPI